MLLRLKSLLIVVVFITSFLSCENRKKQLKLKIETTNTEASPETLILQDTFVYKDDYVATKFDFPIGKPNAKGYYNAQGFGKNNHLGDDWNGVKDGNSDLGDSIYAIANGYVSFAENIGSGWGNVIRIIHKLDNGKEIESLYAHCDTILVKKNQWLKKGNLIGTIGNAEGIYYAHLHLEIRDEINLSIGAGYSNTTKGYLDPTEFINNHRK